MPHRARDAHTNLKLKHAIGLELGSANLKVVELQRGHAPKLEALGMRPTPAGLLQDDRINDREALAEEIRVLLRDSGVHRKRTLTAVGNKQAVTRTISMPNMTRAEIAEAITWEAERYLPFPIDEVALDHALLDDPDTAAVGSPLEVMIAAARTTLLDDHTTTLRLAGLQPVAIDVKPFALLRAIAPVAAASQSMDPSHTTAVVECGASESTLTLLRGQRVLMNRNLGVSGDDFTQAIQKTLGVSFAEAETLKQAIADDATSPAAKALASTVNTFLAEVRRTLEFAAAQHADTTLQALYLAGGGANLASLKTQLQSTVGVPVNMVQPYEALQVDARRFDMDLLTQLGPAFAVPIGLALRGVGA